MNIGLFAMTAEPDTLDRTSVRVVTFRSVMESEEGSFTSALSDEQRGEIDALAKLPDERIDTSDLPEILDWSGAKRGLLYRPIKRQITLRLDADVVAWFKANAPDGRGYQTEINRVLREHARRSLRQP